MYIVAGKNISPPAFACTVKAVRKAVPGVAYPVLVFTVLLPRALFFYWPVKIKGNDSSINRSEIPRYNGKNDQ